MLIFIGYNKLVLDKGGVNTLSFLISGANVYRNGEFKKLDIFVSNGRFIDISSSISDVKCDSVFKFNNCFVFPGLIDVHVHLREPGFLYKESIKSGTMAAARGGYTDVCAMPNLNPVPDCAANLRVQTELIEKDAMVHVYPYAAITVNQRGEKLSALEEMRADVCGFTDDGKGVQRDEIMRRAMEIAKKYGKIIAAHCEDEALLGGSCIHDGEFARKLGHKGITSESEWKQIERDLKLVREIGCRYHVCHLSTAEGVELIRNAKKDGLLVTCETAPHYLVLDDSVLIDDGRFKMNPPIRTKRDKEALIKGICDGTIDMIATDHAPHSHEEKSRGILDSTMGITGLECAFPVLYTELVKTGVITLEKLVALMSDNPRKIFGIGNEIKKDCDANFCVFDLGDNYNIDAKTFLSKGRSTPFDGKNVFSKCVMTVVDGRIIWQENLTER